MFHKKYCGKSVYVFEVKLLGSQNPVIKRRIEVPSWYTFMELHATIQYAFGPWQNTHIHEFLFRKQIPGNKGGPFDPAKRILRISEPHPDDDDWMMGQFPRLTESTTKLSDIYEADGAHRKLAELNGRLAELVYIYDFGDHWEHVVTFKRTKIARDSRPIFTKAIGYGPVEDSGGVTGWQEVKDAFATTTPTRDQLEKRHWALETAAMADRNDPLAPEGSEGRYDPNRNPNLKVMNYEGRWENHFRGYLGLEDEEFDDGDDDDLDDGEEFAF